MPGLVRLGLALGLFLAYTSNRRQIGAGDVVPATLQAAALARGDGLVLDRFERVLRTPEGTIPGYAEETRGHVVSRYPIGPALVAAPFVLPQVWWLDLVEPGWESSEKEVVRQRCAWMGKNAAAAISAMGAVAIGNMLAASGLARVALAATLVVALGTCSFAVGSQALWQHGPAMLCLSLATLGLVHERHERKTDRRLRLAGAGLFSALAVACRPIDIIYSLGLLAWTLLCKDRAGRWAFALPFVGVGLLLAAYNIYFFDTLSGGYAAIEQMHPWAHGVAGTWATPLGEGAAGTLLSPSHGLFVYCPWLLLALVVSPMALRSAEITWRHPAWWLLVALAPSGLLLSKYSCWWGGHCFGPRFWIDANPAIAVLVAAALFWSIRARGGSAYRFAFAAAFSLAVAIQLVGFLCYPTSWYGSPTNADRDHVRLWDWSDNEVTRGLKEGIKPSHW